MYNWDDFINDFPHTNFSDINVSWFLNKFKQIFDEWEGLYNQMLSWKEATDTYNATWRAEQEQAFTTWENNFESAIDAWKTQTETDIGTWETDTIATLEAWKAVFITQYNTLKLEVEQIAEDAETAKNAAQASATSAANSASSASATALALQNSLEQIDINTNDISDLKTQLNEGLSQTREIVSNGRNLFDKNSVWNLPGYFIVANGTFRDNPSMTISHYIPVKAGGVYRKRYDETVLYNNVYDKKFELIETYVETVHTMPANAAYVRISIRNGFVNSEQFETGDTFTGYEAYKNYYNVKKADAKAEKNLYNIKQISEINYYKNIANPAEIETGKIINYTNGLVEDGNYNCSGFIPVSKNVMYMFRGTVSYFAFYDGNKDYISLQGVANNITNYSGGTVRGFDDNLLNTYFISPVDGYVRVTMGDPTITFIAIKSSTDNTSLIPHASASFEAPIIIKIPDEIKREQINIIASEGIQAFYDKMMYAFNTGNCDVHVGIGTYEYTNALVESIRSANRRGIPIGNGCRYYFATGAYIICDYTGTEWADVVNLFTPLDSWNRGGDYELYNLHLLAKNTCYAVHDEAAGADAFCKHIYHNCYIELDNTALGENGNGISKAIGGGLGKHELVIMENSVFKATNTKVDGPIVDASYHGASGSTFTDANIIVTGCYFENGFRVSDNNYPDIVLVAPFPEITYTNNSSKYEPAFSATHTVRKWNNVIRT